MKTLIAFLLCLFLVCLGAMELTVGIKRTKVQYIEQKCADFDFDRECKDIFK